DGLTWGPHDAQESLTLFHNYTGDHYNGSHTPTQNPPTPTGPPAPAQGAKPPAAPHLPAMREEDLGRHGTTHLPPIEDLARTIRQLAGEQTGAHLDTLATHLSRTQAEIRDALTANGINVKTLQLRFGDERRQRLGVRVDDLGRHGTAHLPTVEDLARTIRRLARERAGVHLATLATHLRDQQEFKHLDLQRYEIRDVLQAAGISVQKFNGLDGETWRERLGVRVDALGRHGLAHLPTIEDLAQTIRQLAAANNHLGVHLDALTTHLRSLPEFKHLGLQEFDIRNVLAANGITVRTLRLQFGGKQHKWLGVRVDDLG
ncbi:hypothetical protein, partial [Streptomyces sp. NPDC002403]